MSACGFSSFEAASYLAEKSKLQAFRRRAVAKGLRSMTCLPFSRPDRWLGLALSRRARLSLKVSQVLFPLETAKRASTIRLQGHDQVNRLAGRTSNRDHLLPRGTGCTKIGRDRPISDGYRCGLTASGALPASGS